METKILQLAVNNLMDEVEKLKAEINELRSEVQKLNQKDKVAIPQVNSQEIKSDELMDIKEVQSTLGICYNSLNKLVKKGLLIPIRINQRRIRFSRKSIIQFIDSNH